MNLNLAQAAFSPFGFFVFVFVYVCVKLVTNKSLELRRVQFSFRLFLNSECDFRSVLFLFWFVSNEIELCAWVSCVELQGGFSTRILMLCAKQTSSVERQSLEIISRDSLSNMKVVLGPAFESQIWFLLEDIPLSSKYHQDVTHVHYTPTLQSSRHHDRSTFETGGRERNRYHRLTGQKGFTDNSKWLVSTSRDGSFVRKGNEHVLAVSVSVCLWDLKWNKVRCVCVLQLSLFLLVQCGD